MGLFSEYIFRKKARKDIENYLGKEKIEAYEIIKEIRNYFSFDGGDGRKLAGYVSYVVTTLENDLSTLIDSLKHKRNLKKRLENVNINDSDLKKSNIEYNKNLLRLLVAYKFKPKKIIKKVAEPYMPNMYLW